MCENLQDKRMREQLQMLAQECLSRKKSGLSDLEEESSSTETLEEMLKDYCLPSVATSEREKDLLSRYRYNAIRNAIGMNVQMSKRMEALECIMEAYPSSFTLKEVKEHLECTILKNDKEIRELVKVK